MISMDCIRIEQLISAYLDGELTPSEAGAVRSHLDACAICRREYENMAELSDALKQVTNVVLQAPAGFKDAIMLQIANDEKLVVSSNKFRRFNQSWKQLAAGVAAALLLVFGAVNINFTPWVQIAKNEPVVKTVQPSLTSNDIPNGNNNPVPVNPTNNDAVVPPETKNPVAANNNSNDVPLVVATVSEVSPKNTVAPVFLNKERSEKTTILKLRVDNVSQTQEKVIRIAGDLKAQVQNLGQQVNTSGTYTALKIKVAKSSASILLNKLGSLGTVISQEVDNKDISSRYAETLSQYQTLITQRATIADGAQKTQLDQRIATLQKELSDWEHKAEQETIILWLEK